MEIIYLYLRILLTKNKQLSDSELQSFTSDGFTVGMQPNAGGDGKNICWLGWKANGGTTTTNDASSTGVGNY